MSIQNVSSSSSALSAQLLQQQQSGSSSFNSQDLPQLSTAQVQSLQQALQDDVQQSLAGSGGSGNFQSQLDGSVSNTLSHAGFSQSQIQTVIDKLNQGSGRSTATHGHGHGHGHHARRVLNSLTQALSSNASGQTPSSTGSAASSSSTAASSIASTSSSAAGQSLNVVA